MNLEIPPDALAINQSQNAGKTPEESKILKAQNFKLPGLTRYREGVMKESFYFVQIVDPRFGLAASPEESCEDEKNNMEKLVTLLNELNPKPRFVVVCGNFTNSKPDEQEYFPQVETFKSSFDKLDSEIPVICVCGRNEFDKEPQTGSMESYRRNFGEDWFAFWIEGVQFIVLNSLYYDEFKDLGGFSLEQDEWLDSVLLEAQVNPPQYLVVVQNKPWFLTDSNEPENDNNIRLSTRHKTIPKMKEANVKAIISGNSNNSSKNDGLEAIQTSPLSDKNNPGFRIFKVKPDSIEHKYFTLDNTPKDLNNEFN